jgi:hypothetical protein
MNDDLIDSLALPLMARLQQHKGAARQNESEAANLIEQLQAENAKLRAAARQFAINAHVAWRHDCEFDACECQVCEDARTALEQEPTDGQKTNE